MRTVGKEAARQLADIHAACFPNYWDPAAFNDFFAVAGTRALLVGDPPQGMMVYRLQFEQADIITIAVLPPYRRQGLARCLLAAALEDMQASGVETAFLDVEDGNEAAIGLYESAGFTVQRRRRLYYRQKDGTCTDALVMSRNFS